jgi:AbrB family looped-hinge helix DNA binding protein
MAVALATLTKKGQLTVPKPIRDSLGLHTGDKVEFSINKNGEAIFRPVTKRVDDVFGRLHKSERSPLSVEQMDAVIRQRTRARCK